MSRPRDDRDLPRGIATVAPGPVHVHFDGACETVGGLRVAAYGFTVEGPGLYHEEAGAAVPPGHPRATNNVAEYVAAISALEWLRRREYAGEVVVTGDSQLVIRQMTGEYEVRAEHLEPYHERLVQLVQEFSKVEFVWVPRSENSRADTLSKAGIASVSGGSDRPGRPTRPSARREGTPPAGGEDARN